MISVEVCSELAQIVNQARLVSKSNGGQYAYATAPLDLVRSILGMPKAIVGSIDNVRSCLQQWQGLQKSDLTFTGLGAIGSMNSFVMNGVRIVKFVNSSLVSGHFFKGVFPHLAYGTFIVTNGSKSIWSAARAYQKGSDKLNDRLFGVAMTAMIIVGWGGLLYTEKTALASQFFIGVFVLSSGRKVYLWAIKRAESKKTLLPQFVLKLYLREGEGLNVGTSKTPVRARPASGRV